MIIQKSFPQNHDILYYVDKDNPLGPVPTNPSQDPQFNEWEKDVQIWAAKYSTSTATTATGTPPTTYDNIHTAENKPTIKIISPANNSIISGDSLTTDIQASAPRGISSVNYYINVISLPKDPVVSLI